MSNLILITGAKGSGKSYLSLRLGELIEGKKFGMQHVCFSINQLFDILNNKKYSEGDVIVLEEIGIAANSRDAMSSINKQLSYLAQAIRPARITLIINTIVWGLMDSQVRNMIDYKIEIINHKKELGLTNFKFFILAPSPYGQDPYKAHMSWRSRGESIPITYTSWLIKKPSPELAVEYEAARKSYLDDLYKAANETIATGKNVRLGVEKEPLVRTKYLEEAHKTKDFILSNKELCCGARGKLNIEKTMAASGIESITSVKYGIQLARVHFAKIGINV